MTTKWESNLLIMSMITDRIGQHKVLLPINQNCYKIGEKNQTFVICSPKKKRQWLIQQNARQQCTHMTCSVHLHRHQLFNCSFNCPIASSVQLVPKSGFWQSIMLENFVTVLIRHIILYPEDFLSRKAATRKIMSFFCADINLRDLK